MATVQKSVEGTATCPLCSDYTGQPSSVEAHISRMTDPVHQGEVGRAHRDDLRNQVAESGDVETTEEPVVETTEKSSENFSGNTENLSENDSSTVPEDAHPPAGELGRTFDSEENDVVDELEDDQDESDEQVSPTGGDPDPSEQAGAGDDDQHDRADRDESEPAGIPIPVSSTTLIGGVAAVVVIVFMYRRIQKRQVQESQQDEQSQQRDTAGGGGGLVGTEAATIEELTETLDE